MAAKSYDAAVTQLVGWYEDKNLGGLHGCVGRMLEADPDFILGQALAMEISFMGGLDAPRLNEKLAQRLAAFNAMVEKRGSNLHEHELLHFQVINHWARDDLRQAARVLETITTYYPEDIAALKMLQDLYFFMGMSMPMRNSIANALSRMDSKLNPLKGYAYGMFAFSLEESNMYSEAQEQALKAIELIPRDTWAIHNYAHCLEMRGQTEEGLKWMLDKQVDWQPCQTLASHQYWHTALFHINNNNFSAAESLLGQEILPRCKVSSSALDMHDGCSMIYRMQLVDLFKRIYEDETEAEDRCSKHWDMVYDRCLPHKRDHLIGFNDAHYMMSFLGKGDLAAARELIDSIDEVPSLRESQTVVKPLLEAMLEFKLGNYSKCVELLEPIRFDISKIGGSHAQRDIFEHLLITAACKSDNEKHQELASRMLKEREVFHNRRTIQTELLDSRKKTE